MSGGGRGGGGPRGRGPTLAEMQHIRKELQKCTTLTHSKLDDDLERIPSVSGSDSESEGAGRLFTPLSFHLPCKLQTPRSFRNSVATPQTSNLVQCGESRAIMSNCSIISMSNKHHWSVQKKGGKCFWCSIVCLFPFLPTPTILKAKIEDCCSNIVAFARGHGWTGVMKNVLMERRNMISATQGRSDTSGMTKEPCYRCAEGAGEKNWPKRKKVPRTLMPI